MSRKLDHSLKELEDQIINCFIHPEGAPNAGQEATTRETRRAVAEHWCQGDYHHHRAIAEQHGLLPIALIVASLLDIDHPLLCSASSRKYNALACAIKVLEVMNNQTLVASPVEVNSFNSPIVERMPRLVE